MLRKLGSWFSGLSKAGKTGVILASIFVVGAAASPATNQTNTQNQNSNNQTQQAQETKAESVEKRTVIEFQDIPFKKTTVEDGTLEKGKTALQTAGVNGSKTVTYEVTYTNGAETNKEKIKEEITTKPVDQVTRIGTKVATPQTQGVQSPAPKPALNCPNGTYTNSYGDVVCRPYSTPSAPAGATARCRDGTYSFSQSRRGTCSHHGGVAQWL